MSDDASRAQSTNPRILLADFGIRPKKRFGQNFLVDYSAAQRIARLCAAPGVRLIEIGAGTGTLTCALLDQGAAVTAIEIDRQLVALLHSQDALRAATIVEGDALEFDYATWAGDGAWHVAGNLPYNVGTPLIFQFCQMERGPQTLTVMLQKDVADRLVARPGTAAYGSLSLAVQYAMDVERAFTLGPGAFYPQPKIRSTVVRMRRSNEPPVRPRDLSLFWKVVRGGFAYRRKTLVNSLVLALGIDRADVERALRISNIPVEQRGERLDLDAFARLADALAAQ